MRSAALAALAWATMLGCATYSDHLEAARAAVDRGDLEQSIEELNDVLGVGSHEEIPDRWTTHRPLAALERGILLQAREEWELSARDLSAAETELEFLDLRLDTPGNIGKYIYNDSAEVYKTPPTERLALNAMNMLNFLALGNLQGASVEARRFQVMHDYLTDIGEQSHGAFGSYLAGFTFERLGELGRARRHYAESRIEVETGGTAGAPPTEILTVLAVGRVPYKVPKRITVDAAVALAGAYVTGDTRFLAHSVASVVVYPELERTPSRFHGGEVRIDGRPVPVKTATDLGLEISREYEALKPKIIGAALTRMIARAAAAEGARVGAGRSSTTVGLLAALATKAALVGLDKPDTRSWIFLPERILLSRSVVAPGAHEVTVQLGGLAEETRRFRVDVAPGSFAVLVVTAPR